MRYVNEYIDGLLLLSVHIFKVLSIYLKLRSIFMSILMVCCRCLFTFSKKYISQVEINFHVKHMW